MSEAKSKLEAENDLLKAQLNSALDILSTLCGEIGGSIELLTSAIKPIAEAVAQDANLDNATQVKRLRAHLSTVATAMTACTAKLGSAATGVRIDLSKTQQPK